MRALFDITHPADVHLFKNVIHLLKEDDHVVLVTAREKDVTTGLLEALKIDHVPISRIGRGMAALAGELLARDVKLLGVARRFRPDVMVARIGISIGLVGAILGVPRVVFEDTEHAKLQLALSLPFATTICTGTGYLRDLGPRQARFRGVPVLAYLSPKYFQPDPAALREHDVEPDEPYVVLRTVSWAAAHDVGLAGSSTADLHDAVDRLSRFGRVLISSEKPLPPSLERFRSPVPAEAMHDLLAFATLFIGEGGTMAAEAAVLGTPAIFTSPLRTGYLLALDEQYQLLRNVDTMAEGLEAAEQWLARNDLRRQWQQRRQKLLDDSDDVTVFMREVIKRASPGDHASTAGRGPGISAGEPASGPVRSHGGEDFA